MIGYLVRRLLYAVPILCMVNFLTFLLFFEVNTPDDMARMQLGAKRVTAEAISQWKREHGYDKPQYFNEAAAGTARFTDTIFFDKSVRLFAFEFGNDTDNRSIRNEILTRMWPSLALQIPVLIVGLALNITFALGIVFFRGTYLDFWGVVTCIVAMSVSSLFYIISGQYVLSKEFALVPISGFAGGLDAFKFLVVPAIVGIVSGIGSSTRLYRIIFLEEISRDYVRTARAKGLSELVVLFTHVLKNAMIPILTGVVAVIPLLFLGSLLMESFFGIPGLGSYTMDAIQAQDFSVVRSMVFLGTMLYIAGLMLTDVSYTLVDPRVRFE